MQLQLKKKKRKENDAGPVEGYLSGEAQKPARSALKARDHMK